MYLVRVTPPINFTFSDDSVFLKKMAGDINSLNLLVGYYIVSNVLSPRDLVSTPDNMDETILLFNFFDPSG